MILITAAVASPDAALATVVLRVERRTLAKRLWRGTAPDGQEFGFELAAPLKPGDTFHQNAAARYVLEQEPEPVLEVDLEPLPASAAAAVGWAVGNLHLELSGEPRRLLTPDEPAARQLFERLGIHFVPTTAVFRPGRFSRGAGSAAAAPAVPSHDLGPSHRH